MVHQRILCPPVVVVVTIGVLLEVRPSGGVVDQLGSWVELVIPDQMVPGLRQFPYFLIFEELELVQSKPFRMINVLRRKH